MRLTREIVVALRIFDSQKTVNTLAVIEALGSALTSAFDTWVSYLRWEEIQCHIELLRACLIRWNSRTGYIDYDRLVGKAMDSGLNCTSVEEVLIPGTWITKGSWRLRTNAVRFCSAT
ncbi:Hypothetical predicted protein [Olea europaea subsp. europaea]|uniref:Uncharacterized protein n=1 Tax=Olea europaea subsp. europaea TaxID=158383 RepID=A0A8S0S727_OLEEU|nr:Hypothetical predicted protein [Olea europaea subsp. europaea]